MLFPPGRVLWRPQRPGDAAMGGVNEAAAHSASDWIEADPSSFDSILLCGSQMLTSHFPRSYLDAIGREE